MPKGKLKIPSKEKLEAMEDRFIDSYARALIMIAKDMVNREQKEKESMNTKEK